MCRRKTSPVASVLLSLAILVSFCVFFSSCSCGYTQGADAERTGADGLALRVMSFNIRYGTANDGENRWENRRRMVFEVIGNQRSDVVGLQEALRFQIDQIIEAVPAYAMVGVGRDDGETKGEYSAILYRTDRFKVGESGTFWLSDTPQVPGSITWGNACTRICTWARFIENKSGRAFYLFNTHLDHVSQPSRQKSAALLAQRIHSRKHAEPFVLTGDFNVGEDNPVVTYLKGKTAPGRADEREAKNPVPVVDTFRVLHSEATAVGTFNGFKGNREGDKIDYVFTPPGVKVLSADILRDNVAGRYPSDHFPVTAQLRLPIARPLN